MGVKNNTNYRSQFSLRDFHWNFCFRWKVNWREFTNTHGDGMGNGGAEQNKRGGKKICYCEGIYDESVVGKITPHLIHSYLRRWKGGKKTTSSTMFGGITSEKI